MSIDLHQLRFDVIRPTLRYLDPEIPYSRAAENLILGTILVESNGEYIRQLGEGPALGLVQMEVATHDDHWANWLAYRETIATKIRQLETPAAVTAGALELIGNLYYAVAMCRVHYARVPEKLAPANDFVAMAAYHKRWYNTSLGKTELAKSTPYFRRACA